jgi:DNA-binding MarR family transcriptional regulator
MLRNIKRLNILGTKAIGQSQGGIIVEDLQDTLFRAMSDFRRMPARVLGLLDLSPGELATLKRISLVQERQQCGACGGDEELYVSGLHDRDRMSMSMVSQSLSSLERRGFVTRSVSERDRRKIAVALTPAGEAYVRHVNQRMHTLIQRTAERFGEAELLLLVDQLHRLIEVMDAVRLDMEQENAGENDRKGDEQS